MTTDPSSWREYGQAICVYRVDWRSVRPNSVKSALKLDGPVGKGERLCLLLKTQQDCDGGNLSCHHYQVLSQGDSQPIEKALAAARSLCNDCRRPKPESLQPKEHTSVSVCNALAHNWGQPASLFPNFFFGMPARMHHIAFIVMPASTRLESQGCSASR